MRNPTILGVWGSSGGKGTRVLASRSQWRQPEIWDRAARDGVRRDRVFCASIADVFEDWDGPLMDAHGRPLWVAERLPDGQAEPTAFPANGNHLMTMADARRNLFLLIDRTPNLDWLLLTKRPENITRLWPDGRQRDNVWLGCTVENAEYASIRIPRLLEARHLVRILFLSAEPLLGPLDDLELPGISWVICGGESGATAKVRPFDVNWARGVVRQCREFDIPVFVKQMGTRPVQGRTELIMSDHKGGDFDEFPADLQIREVPGG